MLKPQNEIGMGTAKLQLDTTFFDRIGHVSCWLINKSVFLLAPLQTNSVKICQLRPAGVVQQNLSINHTISDRRPGPKNQKKGNKTKHLLLLLQGPVLAMALQTSDYVVVPHGNSPLLLLSPVSCPVPCLWPAANEISELLANQITLKVISGWKCLPAVFWFWLGGGRRWWSHIAAAFYLHFLLDTPWSCEVQASCM